MDILSKTIKTTKIPVYFMPGLAASSSIFENIHLPEAQFDCFLLDWFVPEKDESLQSYAKQMAALVTHKNAVLIGVSFGGILVQEMAQFVKPKKVIIISSVKSNSELPQRMKIVRATKAYKIVPTGLLENVEILSKYIKINQLQQRLKLYERYLKMKDKSYLDWAIKQVVCWNRTTIDLTVIHVHGDADEVFPVKNIKNFINIKGGTHMMILNRFRWFNQHLPELITN